jgi:hypothetical protein
MSSPSSTPRAPRRCGTIMSLRPGNHPQPPHDHRVVQSFDEI